MLVVKYVDWELAADSRKSSPPNVHNGRCVPWGICFELIIFYSMVLNGLSVSSQKSKFLFGLVLILSIVYRAESYKRMGKKQYR